MFLSNQFLNKPLAFTEFEQTSPWLFPPSAPTINEQVPLQDKNSIHETPSLNSFLYHADDFGKMRKGVVLENNTYTYDKKGGNDNFEIQPATKK